MRADRLDALLWLVLPTFVLAVVPIGFVSGDGVGQGFAFEAGTWHLDPNHLLFEPLGAGWLALCRRLGCEWPATDVLKVLSAIAGALAVAIFRWLVAPRLAAGRWAANHATAWMAISSAFLRHWLSDEIHMIQMPFLVAVAWLALLSLEREDPGLPFALGTAVGVAGLAFVSNLLLVITLAALLAGRHLRERGPRRAVVTAATVGVGALLAAGPPLVAAWRASGARGSLLTWLSSYGGAQAGTRAAASYGVIPSAAGVGEALVRSAYGAAGSLVDLGPVASAVRDRQALSATAVVAAVAFLAAAAALLVASGRAWRDRPAGRCALLLVLAWSIPFLAFGIFWNNSDAQFFFQLAPAFGILAAWLPAPGRRPASWLAVAGLAALLWNLGDVTRRMILYPRQQRIALLEHEVRGACLVILPGFDESETLLALTRRAQRVPRLSLVEVALAEPASTGLPRLRRRIDACLASGERVVLLDVFATPPLRSPWKYLRRLGYERTAVEGALRGLPRLRPTRRAGPFTVAAVPATRPAWPRPSPSSG